MIAVPNDRRVLLYGPEMVNVESEWVHKEDVGALPQLRDYMISVMREWSGLGLAAPQVGVFKQFFVFEMQGGAVIDMVNPEIVHMRGREVMGTEACISVPPSHNTCLVPRMEYITVEYGDSREPFLRKKIELTFRDAAVAQHEYDHLTGNFFFDRVADLTKSKVLDSFNKWKVENHIGEKENSRSFAPACA